MADSQKKKNFVSYGDAETLMSSVAEKIGEKCQIYRIALTRGIKYVVALTFKDSFRFAICAMGGSGSDRTPIVFVLANNGLAKLSESSYATVTNIGQAQFEIEQSYNSAQSLFILAASGVQITKTEKE